MLKSEFEKLLGMPLTLFAKLDRAVRLRIPGVGDVVLASKKSTVQWLRSQGVRAPILTAYQMETLFQVVGEDQHALRLILEALIALEGELVGVFLKGGRKDGVSPSPTKAER